MAIGMSNILQGGGCVWMSPRISELEGYCVCEWEEVYGACEWRRSWKNEEAGRLPSL